MRRPSSLWCRALEQHTGVVAKGAHIVMHAKAGRTGAQSPLVLPSHTGELVAPKSELEKHSALHKYYVMVICPLSSDYLSEEAYIRKP